VTVADLRVTPVAGGVAAPAGFRAAGVACGIKKSGLDLSLVAADARASAAAVFTTNKAQAAPVLIAREYIGASGGHARAVIINSGCANACTGEEGIATARAMADAGAAALRCDPTDVLVASTGVIGVALDRDRVTSGIADAARALASDGGAAAARAIMTTDPFPNEAAVEIATPAGTFRVGGMAKGSGMIEPMMATMLAVVTTDAEVPPALLQRALAAAVETTFNSISVDGECSTNDCVFALASRASGVTIRESDMGVLTEALRQVCEPLAVGIVRGGEGATKLITIEVSGGRTHEQAK
jgi:glutamate N-acetyltransferase / amino-acid N-acetyltransferase